MMRRRMQTTLSFVTRLSLLAGIISGTSFAAVPPAQLSALPTVKSELATQHLFLTECDGKMYYTAAATSSSSKEDGLYWYNGVDSKLVVESNLGKMRGLTCHLGYLYYFKRVIDDDPDNQHGFVWSFFRYKEGEAYDSFIDVADHLSHDPPTPYEGDLYIGGQGPKLYKVTTGTETPHIGVAWESPADFNDEAFPEELVVHKGESKSDLYFVALDKTGDHKALWKFNVHKDDSTMLKDLVLRTGNSDGTVSDMISFKNSREFVGSLYFSLGPFDKSDGRSRLAKWDGEIMPVVTQVTDLDPSHLVAYQDSLYMSLRDDKDASKYALWKWDGRFVRQVAKLPDEGKIHRVVIWKDGVYGDDILAMSGANGPLVVWNGEDAETVTVTTNLFDVSQMIPFQGQLLLTAAQKADAKENKIWSLTKGVFETTSGSNQNDVIEKPDKDTQKEYENKGDVDDKDNKTEDNKDGKGDSSGSVQPAWTAEKEVSKKTGKKVFLWFFFLALFGGLGWWIYKKWFADGGFGIERTGISFHSDSDSKEIAHDDDVGTAATANVYSDDTNGVMA